MSLLSDLKQTPVPGDPVELIAEIQRRSLLYNVHYLLESTALTDLAYWAHKKGKGP